MRPTLLVLGAGGHGKVVAEAALASQRWQRIAFVDDRYPRLRSSLQWPVIAKSHDIERLRNRYPAVALGIGDNITRGNRIAELLGAGFDLPTIIHPGAQISNSARLGPATVVMAQAAINAEASLGSGCVVNTGATVDHECRLDRCVHISPGAHLGGQVSIGAYSWIGLGCAVKPRLCIGANVIVGMGSVVIRNIGDNVTVAGAPARII